MATREPLLLTEPLGGSPLARAAGNGATPEGWYPARPGGVEAWRARAEEVRTAAPSGWWSDVREACGPSGAALDRITRVVKRGGVVVTTGQQPGLFGGAVYTWSKAMSALAMADELEASTGIPTAPVFWAATDDADFAEAAWTMVSLPGGAERLELPHRVTDGMRLADVPLGDVTSLLASLRRAARSAIDSEPLDATSRSYTPSSTVGGAYVSLLRRLLEPLGIVVLDASHEAISAAAHPFLVRALDRAEAIDKALRARTESLRTAGFNPQVEPVDGLSLVFERSAGAKQRVPIHRARSTPTATGPAGDFSPNVLLRPVVERALLPTMAYMAGPGELAYFAQVSAVASALALSQPLALPRWSVTIVEPHIVEILDRHGVTVTDFAEPHVVETRLAKAAWPEETSRAVGAMRAALESLAADVRHSLEGDGVVPPSSIDAVTRAITWRLDRLSRRVTAGVKRREASMMRDLGTARGALFPGGLRQERALNLMPILARHGANLLERMRDRAREHAGILVGGEVAAPARS